MGLPALWSAEGPHLYVAVLTLRDASGALVDCEAAQVAFRHTCVDGATGRLLHNGAGLLLRGVNRHEHELLVHATEELEKIDGIRLFGSAPRKAAILSYHYASAHPHDVGTILDTEGVAIRVGHHCAQPLMDYLKVPATARASFSFYNSHEDVEAFVRAMRKVERFFG